MDLLNRLSLAEPRWLAAGFVAAAMVALFGRTQALRRNAAPFRTALRIGCVVATALALSAPTWERHSKAVTVIAVIDESASVSEAVWSQETRWLEQVRHRAVVADPQGFQILRFARTPAKAINLLAPRPKGEAALGTNIAMALGLALGQVPPDRLASVLLITDGKETHGNAASVIPAYRKRKIPIFARPVPVDTPGDVAIVRMTAPPVVRPKAGFAIDVELTATREGPVRVNLVQDGGPERGGSASEQTAVLSPHGDTWRGRVSFQVRIEAESPSVFRVTSQGRPRDERPDNDGATLVIRPHARPRVLVIAANGKPGAFENVLRAQDLEVQTVSVARLPPASDLDRTTLVVLADSAGTIPRAWQDALAAGIRNGLGLVVAGGASGLPAGPLGDLLPVLPDPVTERKEPSLALGLVIDRSGSMSGPKMDLTREAARATAEKLAPEDLITIVVFDSQPHTVVTLQPAANRQRILSDISQISASGGTNLGPALRDALEQLIPVAAPKKHLIVLSDGQSPGEGIAELVETAVAANVTVSAVGVGDGADLALLQSMSSRGGGRFYHARDPASIPRIFTKETHEMNMGEAADTRTFLRSARKSDLFAASGIDRAPPLHGRTRIRPRPRTDVLVETPDHTAMLVRGNVGLGRVIVWASDLDGHWSSDFARWPGYPKFWTQIVRNALRREGANETAIDLRADRGRIFISIPQAGTGTVDLFAFQRDTERLLKWPAPAKTKPLLPLSTGRWGAEFSMADDTVAVAAQVRVTDESGGISEAEGFLSLPPAPEFSIGSDGSALLRMLTSATRGQMISDDLRPLFDPAEPHAIQRVPLRAPLLWVVLALFLAELGIWRATFRGPVERRAVVAPPKPGS